MSSSTREKKDGQVGIEAVNAILDLVQDGHTEEVRELKAFLRLLVAAIEAKDERIDQLKEDVARLRRQTQSIGGRLGRVLQLRPVTDDST
ncbi:MAG: hypothetical protein ABII72_02580, partial [Parcubacteria group bacterium]